MLKRGLIIAVACVLAFVVFTTIVGLALTRTARGRDALRDILAHEVAQALGREVAVGPIEGDLWTGITIKGLAVAQDDRLAGGAFASAREVRAAYSLWRLIRARGDALGSIKSIAIDRLTVHLVRGPDGKLKLPASPTPKQPSRPLKISGAGPSVSLESFTLSYTDHKLTGPGGEPLSATFRGDLNADQLGRLISALQGRSRSPGEIKLDGRLVAHASPLVLAGNVKADWQRAEVTDLTLGSRGATDDTLYLDRVAAEYRPERLLREKRPAVEVLESLRVEGESVRLSREADGELALLRHVSEWLPKTDRKPTRPKMTVEASITRLTYTDHTVAGNPEPLTLEAEGLNGRVDLGKLFEALDGKRLRPAGEASARLRVRCGGLRASVHVATDITTRATLTDLDSSDHGRSLVTAARVHAEYDLGGLLGEEGAGALRAIEADALRADVTLDERYLPTFLPEFASGQAGSSVSRTGSLPVHAPRKPFGAEVALRDSDVTLTLRSVTALGRPLRVRLSQANVDLDVGALLSRQRGNVGAAHAALRVELGDLDGAAGVSGALGSGLEFASLRLRQRGSEVLWANTGRVEVDCRKLMDAPAAAFSLIAASGVRARIVRDADGKLALVKSLPTSDSPSGGREESEGFGARIKIERGDVTYLDRSRRQGLNAGHVGGLHADVNLAQFAVAQRGDRAPRIGTVRGTVAASGPGVRIAAGLSANLSKSVELRDLVVEEPARVAIARVSRARVEFAPSEVFAGRALEGISHVAVVDADADLVRERDGQLRLARLLGGGSAGARQEEASRAPGTASDSQRFGPLVSLTRVRASLTDHSAPAAPVTVAAEGLGGQVHVGRVMAASRGEPADGIGWVRADVGLESPRLAVTATVDADLDKRISVADLEAYELRDGKRERIVGLPRGVVEYAASGLFAERPLEAVRHIGLEAPDVQLVRDKDGEFELARLVRGLFAEPTEEAEPRDLGELAASVSVIQGQARYVDWSLGNDEQPLVAEVSDLDGEVKPGQIGALMAKRTPEREGRISGEFSARWPGAIARAKLRTDLRHVLDLEQAVLRAATAEAPRLEARRLRAQVDLGDLLNSATPPQGAVELVEAEGLDVDVTRNAEGSVDIARLFEGFGGPEEQPGTTEERARPLESIVARVGLRDSSIRYTDLALNHDGPVTVILSAASGGADLGRVLRLKDSEDLTDIGRLVGTVEVRLPHGAASAGVDSRDLSRHLRLTDLVLTSRQRVVRSGVKIAAASLSPGLLSGRRMLAAEAVDVTYELGEFFAEDSPWPSAFRECQLDEPFADLVRQPDGALDVAKLFGGFGTEDEQPQKSEAPPPESFTAVVSVRGGEGRLLDRHVQDGPVEINVAKLHGKLDARKLWAARAGQYQPGVGRLTGELRTQSPAETISATVRWDADRELTVNDARITQAGKAHPVLALDAATVAYDPAQALAEEADLVAALREVTLGEVGARVRRRADGSFEPPRTVQAYLPEQSAASEESEAGEERGFAGGLTARVRVRSLNLAYEDLAVANHPMEVTVTGGAGDVRFERLAAIRAGDEADAPGWVRAKLRLATVDATAGARVETDLATRARVWDLSLVTQSDGVRRELVAAREADIRAAFAEVLAGEPPTEQLQKLEVWGLWANVRRDEQGVLEIEELLKLGGGEDEQPQAAEKPRLAGKAVVHGADINYEDLSLGVEGGIEVAARELEGSVDLGAIQRLIDGHEEADVGTLEGRLAGRFGAYYLSGGVHADVGRSLEVEGLNVREGFDGEAIVKAEALAAQYDLAGILRGESPAAHVSEVVGRGLEAKIVRNEDGSLELAEGLKLPASEEGEEAEGFAGVIRLAHSDIEFIDYSCGSRPEGANAKRPAPSLTSTWAGWGPERPPFGPSHGTSVVAAGGPSYEGQRGPLWIMARELDAHVDVGALQAMQADGVTRDAGTLRCSLAAAVGQVRARGIVDSRLSSSLAATDLRLATGGDEGDELAAPRLVLQYDLGPILAESSWLEHTHYAGAHDLTARLTREADGELRLVRLVREGLGIEAAAEEEPDDTTAKGGFRGRLAIQNVRVQYTDFALLECGPLVAQVRDASADVDFGALQARSQGEEYATAGSVRANVELRTRTERLSATVGGNLDEEIALAGLSVERVEGAEQVLRADRIALQGSLGELLRSPEEPLSVIKRLELVGVSGAVKRDAAGRIVSPELLSLRPRGSEEVAEPVLSGLAGHFRTWLVVRDVDLMLEDESLLGDDEPLTLRLASLEGDVLAEGLLGAGEDSWVKPQGSLRGKLEARTRQGRYATEFETDLVKHVWARDLRGLGTDGTRLARATEVYASYDLAALTEGRPAYQALDALRLKDAGIAIGASEHGKLTLAGLPLKHVTVRKAGRASFAELADVSGSLQADDRGVIRGELRAGSEGGLLSDTVASVTYDPEDSWLDATASAKRVDLAQLGRLLLRPQDGELIGGYATAQGFACGHIGEEEGGLAWAVQGEALEGQAHLTRLGEKPVRLSGPFKATSEGITTEKARFAWADVEGTVSGAVFDLADPVLAVQIDATAAHGADLVKLLPEEMREKVSALNLTDRTALSAKITGPVDDANAELVLQSAGESMAAIEGLGRVRLKDLNLAASVAGWKDLCVRAAASAQEVAIDDVASGGTSVPLARAMQEERQDVPVPTVDYARLDILAAHRELGDVWLSVPRARVRGLTVSDLGASVRLGDRRIELTGLQGNALGGELRGAGVVALPEDSPAQFSVRMELSGARAAELEAADIWPEDLSIAGELSVVMAGTIGGGETDWGADVRVASPVVNGKPLDSARAIITGKETGTRVELAQLADGPGRLWLRGVIAAPLSATSVSLVDVAAEHQRDADATEAGDLQADLRVAAAEFDVGKLPLELGDKTIGGAAYLSGHIVGPLRDPDFAGWVELFEPEYDGHRGDALIAKTIRTGDQVRLDHLMVSAGQAVAAATGVRIADFRLYEAGDNSDEFMPDGTIRSGLMQAFASAEDLAQVANRTMDTGGWFRMNGAVGGSLRRPTLTSLLSAESVRLGEFFIDEARLPLSLAGDVMLVSDGYARAHGGELSLVGRVDDLYGARNYNLVGTMSRIALEDLPTVHRLGLDASGMVSAPHMTIWGSKDAKPTGSATLRLSGLRLESQEVRPVTGWVQFGQGLVHVDVTKIQKVDRGSDRRVASARQGYVSVSATYDTGRRFLDADVRLAGPGGVGVTEEPPPQALAALPDIGSMLRFAAPIVAIVEAAAAEGQDAGLDAQAASPPGPLSLATSLGRGGERHAGAKVAMSEDSAQLSRSAAMQTSSVASRESLVVSAGPHPADAGHAAPAPRVAADQPSEPVSRQLARLGLRSSGQVAGQFRLLGPLEALSCRTQLSIWNAELDGKALPRQIRASFGADLKDSLLYDVRAEATEGRQYLAVNGEIALPRSGEPADGEEALHRTVDLTVEGADIELPVWRDWLPRPLPVGGAATFLFVARGPSASPTIKGSLDILNPSYAGAQFDVLKLPLIQIAEGAIEVRKAKLIRSEEVRQEGEDSGATQRVAREIAMEGSVPWTWGEPWIPADGKVDLRAELADINLGFFPPILDEIARERSPTGQRRRSTLWSRLEAQGAVSASLSLSGLWGAPELGGQFKLVNGSLRAPDWSRPIEDLQLDVRFVRDADHNRGVVEEARGRWGAAQFTVENAWAYLDHLAQKDLAKNEYHADLTVASEKPMDVRGLRVGKISGGVSFHTQPREEPAEPDEPVARSHELAFNDLTVELGDGNVQLCGWGRLTDFSLDKLDRNEYDVRFTSNSAYLRYAKRLRGVLNGSVRLHRLDSPPDGSGAPEDTLRVDGGLTLDRAELALAAPKGGQEREYRGLSRRYPSPVFDVRLNTGQDVCLRGMGVTVPIALSPVAHISGTLQEPRVAGEVSAKQGAARVPTGAVQIDAANIEYNFGPVPGALRQDRAPLALTGTIHATASRLVSEADVPGWGSGSVQIFIVVDGELPDSIRVNTWSEPPLEEQQILALLGTQPLGGLTVSGRSFEDVLSEQALSVLAAGFKATIFEPIESELMRALGLSEFDITFGFNQSLEVRLGKYFLKDLLVSYRRSVGGGEDDRYTMSLSYRLKSRLHVAYTTNEQNENRVKLTYDVGF